MTLTAGIQEHAEFQREEEWRKAGVPQSDILASRQTGMDARDIRAFRQASVGRVFVIRCPKVTARAMHGLFPPKIMAVKDKTGSSGVVVTGRGMFVSDYDMMSVWKHGPGGWTKIFISAAGGAAHGAWSAEAAALVRELNQKLVSKLQHGCQDDFQSPRNPGVKQDHFAAFIEGRLEHLANPQLCAAFYKQHALAWPYDASGSYTGPNA